MNVLEIQKVWEEARTDCGLTKGKPAPLLHPDESVLLVNAGITVFKQEMLKGSFLPATAISQPCIRTHWGSEGLFMFSMLTAIGSLSSLQSGLDLVTRFFANLSLSLDDFICVLDARDDDLENITRQLSSGMTIERQLGNTDAYWTRWQFGSGSELEGRGLTLVALGAGGQRYSLGNIILVHHAPTQKNYFDIGFGLERIASLFHCGDAWVGSMWQPDLLRLEQSGFEKPQARQLANHLIAAQRLIAEGANPAPRGAGYLTRKLLRQAVDLSMTFEALGEGVEERLSGFVRASKIFDRAADLDTHEAVVEHASAYVSSVFKSLHSAKKAARKLGVEISDLDLNGTYGIPSWARDGVVIGDGSSTKPSPFRLE